MTIHTACYEVGLHPATKAGRAWCRRLSDVERAMLTRQLADMYRRAPELKADVIVRTTPVYVAGEIVHFIDADQLPACTHIEVPGGHVRHVRQAVITCERCKALRSLVTR